jgi:hypothetical protein
LVVRGDGEYSSARDFDKDTLAFLVDDHAGNDDHPKDHIGTSDVDRYDSLIVQRVLSTQIDEDINTSATIIPSVEILGPITRSRAQ